VTSLSNALYAAVSRLGIPRMTRVWTRGAPIFCFHNVVPDELASRVGDASLHVGVDAFRRYLEWIHGRYEVIPLGDLVDRTCNGRPVSGTAAITFDDGYEGVFEHAVPALNEKALPFTLFVISRATGTGTFFWWDLVAEAGSLEAAQRDRFLEEFAGDGQQITQAFDVEGVSLPSQLRVGTWEQVTAAARAGADVGVHTESHRNLAMLPTAEVRSELTESRTTIAERSGTPPGLLSYPYGAYSPGVVREVLDAGFRGAVTLVYGLAGSGADPHTLPRVNVPAGLPLETLDSWAAGIRWRRPTASSFVPSRNVLYDND
jgi:peptidoglycan/xylan/chitin deacetylase (PgdA/CDA1 family)